jgi:hypothetical protein
MDNLPPCAEEAEIGVAGCVLVDSLFCRPILRREGIGHGDFYDNRRGAILSIALALADEGIPADDVLLLPRLQAAGVEADSDFLKGLRDSVPSAANLEYYLPDLKEAAQRRKIIRASFDVQRAASNQDATIEEVVSRASELSRIVGAEAGCLNLQERLFNPAIAPPELRRVYEIQGKPFATPGNLSNVISQVKSGKSAFLGAIGASTLALDGADTLSVSSSNPHCKAVLHFDTEQSKDDHWHQVQRMMRRAGIRQLPEWFLSYCFTGFDARKARAAVVAAMQDAAERFGGIHSALIDGYADLVCDVNDPAECNEFVASFHALAMEYDCPIIGVIHQNPGTEKIRGHLGSQLERKAESNLRLEKEGDIIEVWSDKQRRAPIIKGTGPRFQWCDHAGMHVSDEVAQSAKLNEKRERLAIELEIIFGERSAMTYSDLVSTFISKLKVSESSAERKYRECRQLGLIKKEFGNLYTRKELQ